MRRNEERQPHILYNGGPAPPALPTPVGAAVAINPIEQIAQRFRQTREAEEQKLHETTAATQQSVNQRVREMEREVKRAAEMARAATAAAASSADETRRSRGAQSFLRAVKDDALGEITSLRSQLATMEKEKRVV